MKLNTVEINPRTEAKASIIWLHGLGADGHDFEPIAEELGLPEELGLRFIFPHAPIRPVTMMNRIPLRAWFDLSAINLNALEDETSIGESVRGVTQIIEAEHQRGIEYNNIILAGFSQGAALALYMGLTYPQKLAGIMALSGFLPMLTKLNQRNSSNQSTPIFMAHGVYDPIVPLMLGEGTRRFLQELGYLIEWHTYSMQHSVCAEEIRDIAQWIKKILVP